MIDRPAPSGVRAANDDDVTATVDLLHAVARGTAVPIARVRRKAVHRSGAIGVAAR